ncbi:MAG: hypothetical protein JRH09_09690 [Deltaproteobacteria bacterium]|nr:hypothetical protein [Deltaproteobacteria bacterium]
MDYEVYHDESKVKGYWHGILLVPKANKHILSQLLSQVRENTSYSEHLSIKNVKKENRIFSCADSYVQIGVAALVSSFNNKPYPIFMGQKIRGQKQYSLFNSFIGAKFILFRHLSDFSDMQSHSDYASKVEITYRIGLKGGLHFLGNQSEPINIVKMHFDGHKHYRRHLDRIRIVERLNGLRNYCSISNAEDIIDDRTSNHSKANCQEYDDCQILQLTDLLIGCFRTVLTPLIDTKEIHKKLAQPVKELVNRYRQGPARMRNSRWRNGFCMSQSFLELGDWKFEEIEYSASQEGKQLTMELNDDLDVDC